MSLARSSSLSSGGLAAQWSSSAVFYFFEESRQPGTRENASERGRQWIGGEFLVSFAQGIGPRGTWKGGKEQKSEWRNRTGVQMAVAYVLRVRQAQQPIGFPAVKASRCSTVNESLCLQGLWEGGGIGSGMWLLPRLLHARSLPRAVMGLALEWTGSA